MKIFTKEEAESRIPGVLRNLTLLAIDCMIQLDHYPVNSRAVESRILSVQGYANHLVKLFLHICKAEVEERLATQGMK